MAKEVGKKKAKPEKTTKTAKSAMQKKKQKLKKLTKKISGGRLSGKPSGQCVNQR